MADTGYADLDSMINQSNDLLNQSVEAQNQAVDLGLQKAQNEVDYNKQQYDEQANTEAKQLYQDYKKQSNQYGATAEQIASSGLGNSGYSESSQVSLYNTYQQNYTSLLTETNKLKAEADFNMTQAYVDADIQKAQIQADMYTQKMSLALQEYQLKFERDQWEYQKQRDAISDSQWEREYQLSLQSS